MTPRGLAVLDFSGTLSPAAARFGSWDRITDELRRSGLADIGIVDAGVFWERLVNPTWERGSTTDAGYARVLTQAAVAHLERGGDAVDRAAVATAVQRFADAYLVASAIAPAWRPWLRRLAALERTTVVAATDHYAEATTRIVDEIGTAGVPAIPLGAVPAAGAQPGEAGVLVANSADLGHHKQTRPFWDAVARTVGPVERIAVIDDFGANEPDADAYADRDRVARRREATTALLTSVFDAATTAIPFVLTGHDDPRPAIDRAARDAVAALTHVQP